MDVSNWRTPATVSIAAARSEARARVDQGVRRRAARQVGCRESFVPLLVDALGALADADEHGSPGVEVTAAHGVTVAASATA